MISTLKKYVLIPVIPFVVYLHYNALANVHRHEINGQIIEHFHPYKSNKTPFSPFEQHQHSKNILLILQEIALQNTLSESPLSIYAPTSLLCFIPAQTESIDLFYRNTQTLHRGPPVFA
jgi:hypothetical protein